MSHGLTCLVSSSMQMAPPPRTYLRGESQSGGCAPLKPTPPPCPAPSLSHSPSRQDGRHNPDKWRVKGEVILQERRR